MLKQSNHPDQQNDTRTRKDRDKAFRRLEQNDALNTLFYISVVVKTLVHITHDIILTHINEKYYIHDIVLHIFAPKWQKPTLS